jgi:hypothetical protein
MPTQFKRVSDNPLYTGHFVPLLGTWSEEEGWVKKQDLEYESEVLSCPIIAVVDEKIGKKDLVLTITGKQTQFLQTTQRVDGTYTLNRKTYEDAGTTIQSNLTIPRHTRPYGTFLITGLGQNIWGIQDVTTTVLDNVGKISFYALASAGSKIIYWMGIHFLAEELRDILRPWIAPSKCTRCGATGIEPGTTSTECLQCLGYRFSGYSAVKYVQRKIGFDVGLAREILDWDNLTDDDHDIIRKFISKCHTQKWWVTPTLLEIKRLYSHFYDVPEDDIIITERFNAQEPVWSIFLPTSGSLASPFGAETFTDSDAELMRFIAKSITPAGVSVFVGFYEDFPNPVGDLEDFSDSAVYVKPFEMPYSSLESQFELHGMPRGDFYNGWTKATDHFERETSLGDLQNTFVSGYYPATFGFEDEEDDTEGDNILFIDTDVSGGGCTAIIISDYNGHKKVLKLNDVDADQVDFYHSISSSSPNGTVECWIAISDATDTLAVSLYDGATQLMSVAIKDDLFKYLTGVWNTIIGSPVPSDATWYHIRIDFECGAGAYEGLAADTYYVYINGVQYGSYAFMTNGDNVTQFRINTNNAESGYEGYIDAIGFYPCDSNYEIGDNEINSLWFKNGSVQIVEPNDMNRHMCKITDNSYMEAYVSEATGSFEMWVHPEESDFRVGNINTSGDWMYYIEFDENGFYDSDGYLITMVKPYNDFHLSVDFNHDSGIYDVRVMRESLTTGISYLNLGPVSKFRVQNYGTGDLFVDAIGFTEDPSYVLNDNWQRLYEYGVGIDNENGDGHYKATYGFYTDDDGSNPSDWTLDEGGGTVNVISGLDGHLKVVELNDTNGADNVKMWNTFTVQTDGTIEFWFATNNITDSESFNFYLRESGTLIITIAITDNDLDVYYSGSYHSVKDDFIVANTLYHIKIIMDDTANTCDIYVDGFLESANTPYRNNTTVGIDRFEIQTGTSSIVKGYIDAVGYSWDLQYNIGDNMKQPNFLTDYFRKDRFIDLNNY